MTANASVAAPAQSPATTADAAAPCPICAGPSRQALTQNGYDVFRCEACDFLFVHPYPSGEALAAFYNAHYRQASADHYPKAASRRRRALVRALSLSPDLWGRSVLELGCGGGFMTWAMSFFAARTTGVDISADSIAYAQAHFPRSTFRCATLAETAQCGETFGLVFSSELFEHLPGVDEIMTCIDRVTAPGSLVYVSAPDASHAKTPADLSTWSDICPPEHLQWFGKANLAALFARYGFAPHRYRHAPKPAHNVLFRKL
jgi:2-polyprenyl-3-methyl-5-hydroxy-6-metoxy-1,4-benzoquinol methylase